MPMNLIWSNFNRNKMCMLVITFVVATMSALPVANSQGGEKTIFPFLPNFVKSAKNELCKVHSELYEANLENLTLWAHEMWDASAKYTTGLLRGSVYQMGDWDECITIKGPFKTQYCLATITANVPAPDSPRDPFSLYHSPYESVVDRIYKTKDIAQEGRDVIQVALCIPASCSSKDLEDSLNEYLGNMKNSLKDYNVTYGAKVFSNLCQTQDERNFLDPWDITFCFLSLLIILLVVSSTTYDYVQTKSELCTNTVTQMFLSFSVIKNFPALSKADESNSAMSILYGMRTFCIFVIIIVHRLATTLPAPVLNYDWVEKQYHSPLARFLFQSNLFVDSFFVLSGLLVTYGLLVQYDKKVVNPFLVIFLRYVRLTPAYGYVMFYYATMFYHTGSGPLWKLTVVQEVENCRTNWWTGLLYIGNYVNLDHLCMVHTWYLQCDFHYLILGVLVVTVLHKHKRIGFVIFTSLFVVSMIVPFALTIIYNRPALLSFYQETLKAPRTHPDFQLIYTKSHARATPYIVGMFAGYVYYRLKDTPKFTLSKITSYSLTFASVLILVVVSVIGGIFSSPNYEYGMIESACYAALHRMLWSLGTVGFLISASYGHATILKSAMAWSPWIPLGKLTFATYLIHLTFQIRNFGMTVSPKYLTSFDFLHLVLGDTVLGFIAALFLHLGIEAPIKGIVKQLLAPSPKPKKNKAGEIKLERKLTQNN